MSVADDRSPQKMDVHWVAPMRERFRVAPTALVRALRVWLHRRYVMEAVGSSKWNLQSMAYSRCAKVKTKYELSVSGGWNK